MDMLLPPGVDRPDFIIAAMGRSGSTMLSNWLCRPPGQLVFIEPFFLRASNPRLLRIQLQDFGLPASDQEWREREESGPDRFRRIMGPRLIGKRWAFKEVLHEEHVRTIAAFRPSRVVVAVRNLEDIALSFLEKHRIQSNLDRFGDDWVADYCQRESVGILELVEQLQRDGIPNTVVRYEDFTRSQAAREALLDFVEWEGGGRVASHLAGFDRQFEVDRHGEHISSHGRAGADRGLDPTALALAAEVSTKAETYQKYFGYL